MREIPTLILDLFLPPPSLSLPLPLSSSSSCILPVQQHVWAPPCVTAWNGQQWVSMQCVSNGLAVEDLGGIKGMQMHPLLAASNVCLRT